MHEITKEPYGLHGNRNEDSGREEVYKEYEDEEA